MELEFARLQKLNELQAAIGYKFKDTELLNTALTHTSYVKGDGNGSVHNERLEFLGDAVLELCVSEKLYKEYPELNEGVMTRVRSLSVCEGALHKSAVSFGLGNYLLLSHGDIQKYGAYHRFHCVRQYRRHGRGKKAGAACGGGPYRACGAQREHQGL